MIIIWKGAGPVVFLIGIIVCLLMNIITASLYNQNDYFQSHLWPKLAALWITGLACWFLGRYLNSKPGTTYIDRMTGREVYEKPYHHLMFIKVEYWGVILFGIGLGLLLFSFIS